MCGTLHLFLLHALMIWCLGTGITIFHTRKLKMDEIIGKWNAPTKISMSEKTKEELFKSLQVRVTALFSLVKKICAYHHMWS